MIEAVGLDVGEVTSAAARRRGDEVEPALVVRTADLGGTTARERLASLAARVVGPDGGPAVAVVVPSLDPAARAEVGTAACGAFTEPLLAPRPLAVARWFTHTSEVHPDAVIVVIDVEESSAVVTAVRSGPNGLAIERPSLGAAVTGTIAAVDAVADAVTAWGLEARDVDVAVIVGGAPWLVGVAEGITAATGLAALIDREPLAAAACGAALLVRDSAHRAGAALAIGVPLAGTALLAVPEGGAAVGSGVAAAAGQALGAETEGAGVAAAAGQALGGEPEGAGVAAAAGTALQGAQHPPKRPPPKRPPPKGRAGKVWRPKAALLVAPLVVTLGLGALLIRSCVGAPDTADLVTSAAPGDPSDPTGSTTTIGPNAASAGAGGAKGTPGQSVPPSDPTTATTQRPTTTATPRRPGTVPPPASVGTPADPSPGPPAPPPDVPPADVPPTVANLTRTAASIHADPSPFAGGCEDLTTELSATVTDSSGLARVRVIWSTPRGHGGTIGMTPGSGALWPADLGPVARRTVHPSGS